MTWRVKKASTFSLGSKCRSVSVAGDFNEWGSASHPLKVRGDDTGIWRALSRNGKDVLYKYHIVSRYKDYQADKGDHLLFSGRLPPRQPLFMRIWIEWQDADWDEKPHKKQFVVFAVSVYEIHLGSWRRVPEENNTATDLSEWQNISLNMSEKWVYGHVEFTAIMEHPFYGSWGYHDYRVFALRAGTENLRLYVRIDSLHQYASG